MRYSQFEELCHREWKPETGECGDVTALSLTDESLRELAADRFGKNSCGVVSFLRNPVTCSDVTVTGGAESDMATVSYGTFAWAPEPRTVAIGQAEKRTRVKLADFEALCRREHEENGGGVTALSLTDASHWDLHLSYHASRGILCSLGPLVPRLPNPATGSEVTVEAGAGFDSATVRHVTPTGPAERVVALAQGAGDGGTVTAAMIPLSMRPAAGRVPGMISVPVPSRHRSSMLAASVASLRDTAARPELTEVLVAHDPDDPATADTARSLGADLIWRAPERYGYARSSLYYARLLEQARGEWALVTWSDDAVMETPGWDEKLRALPAGTVAYLDGNFPACTCFPAVHADVLGAVGRLSPLPSLDTWFEDAARGAGILRAPGIYVRQDRPDLNGRNDDLTHREGGAAWRAVNHGYGQDYYREPYTAWRAQDAARMRALHGRQP